ncbi:uncharacterized protein LOC128186598 isoform X2 [Crassostrea angulata]|uniref:uncharacterized protein LOC128186598 isoform X2 n=1 Tax=Magallana angulata TaxID=2784310 RepID=UPI0022B20B6D|nr:uncharacterized protein LOC128186598 isoform X2 [Crassostrea angulata]
MRVNLLLVVLLGLLALSYGFKIERRGNRGKGKGDGEGRGPPEDGGRGPPDGDDDDFDDADKDKRRDLPRLIVGVIAKRIQMQLENCDLSEFDSQPTTIKGAIQAMAELLLMDCGAGPTGSPPTGSPPTDSPVTGPTGNPPASTDGTLPARELEDKVVRELLNFIEKNRH